MNNVTVQDEENPELGFSRWGRWPTEPGLLSICTGDNVKTIWIMKILRKCMKTISIKFINSLP